MSNRAGGRCLLAALWAVVLGGGLARADEEVTLDAQLRLRLEGRDERDFNRAVQDGLTFLAARTRLGVTYQPSEIWTARFQLQDSRTFDSASRTPATQDELEVQEAWLRYQWSEKATSFTLGRQALSFDNQRLIGPFEWSNVARRFDAASFTWGGRGESVQGFAALLGDSPSTGNADGELYGLHYDNRDVLGSPMSFYTYWKHDPSSPFAIVGTLGARRHDQVGPWHYDLEGNLQVGDITAWAVSLAGGRKLGEFTLGANYNLASGDDSPGSPAGGANTFQNLFPTNHLHYGYMDMQGWRNLHNLQFRGTWQSSDLTWLKTTLQYNQFWLYDKADFWYGANGAPNRTTGGVAYRDPAGASGSDVGGELDLVVSASPWKYASFEVGYGRFWPGGFISAVNAANGLIDADSDWFYLQATGTY